MILADQANIRYFYNIASRKRNNGFISTSTRRYVLTSVRSFAIYLKQDVTPQFVSELIHKYESPDTPANLYKIVETNPLQLLET